MSRSVTFDPRALDALRDLKRRDPDESRHIGQTLKRYLETGHGDIKKIAGAGGQWWLRVGDWRLIYERLKDGGIHILDVDQRKDVY